MLPDLAAGIGNRDITDMLARGYRMPAPPAHLTCPPALYDLMLSCWTFEPEKRPTFAFLDQHINDFDVSTERQYTETDDA